MNGNSLVSILIPAYNHEKYVQNTIKSIINQTYQNIELIIIDDGSKDLTWQKIQEMKSECEKRFVRVHFETKQNEGTCKTLNKLLSLTQGEFVYLIASDDMAKSHAIEKEIIFLKNNPDYVLAVGDAEFINADDIRIGWDERCKNTALENAKYTTLTHFFKAVLKEFDFPGEIFGTYSLLARTNHVPNGYLIRKSSLDNITFTPEAPLEDLYLMLQLAKIGKFKFFDDILFSYRWHGENTAAKTAHIKQMTAKTHLYERASLESQKNYELLDVFDSAIEYYRMRINIFNIIKCYYHKSIDYEEDIFEFFKIKIRIRYNDFLK